MTTERVFVRGGAARVTHKDRGRYYQFGDDLFFSVSTIINGGVPKPALINWAKKFTAEFAIEHYSELGALREIDPQGAIDWLKDAAWRNRDAAGNLGTMVHNAAEAWVLNTPRPEVAGAVKPYLDAFLAWCDEWQPSFVAAEAPVFNRAERYAGTLDAILQVDMPREAVLTWPEDIGWTLDPTDSGSLPMKLLVDWKSGSGVYPEAALQLAAYRHAETFLALPDSSEEPVPAVDGCAVLHIQPDGARLVPVRADAEVFKHFLYAREVYRWQREIAKTVIGEAVRR